jgi:hypothetical protein
MQGRIGALAALAAVALTVAACGGGGDGRLSTEEFIEQADAICTTANEEQAALGDVPTDMAGLATYLEQQKAIGEKQLESLRGLEPPEELQPQLNEAYGLLDQVVAKLDEGIAAANAGDVEQLTTSGTDAQELSALADAIANEIGLTVCGQG